VLPGCAGSGNYTNISNFAGFANTDVSATFGSPTPEPSILLTLGGGVLGLASILRRKIKV
jgi:PEP-CTERM motif